MQNYNSKLTLKNKNKVEESTLSECKAEYKYVLIKTV